MADHNIELNVMDADMDFLFGSSSSGLLQPPNLLLDDVDPQSELRQIFRDSFLDGDSDLLCSGDANAAVNTEHSYALSKTISTGSALLDSDVSLWEEDHCDRGGMSGNEGTDNWVDELLSSEALLNANHVAEDEQKAEGTSCPSPSNVSVSSDIDVMSPDSTNPTHPESPISGSRRRKVSGSTSIDKTCEGSSSKNAIAARENRIKKKRYLENLEKKTEELEREKQLMERMAAKQEERIRELQERNMYLENILHNESALSSLLGDLPTTSGVRLSIAGQGGKRKKRRRAGSDEVIPMSRGVCLHVDGQTASLEFCSKCAIMAKGGAP